MLHRVPGGAGGAAIGVAPDRLYQRRALERFEVAVLIEDGLLASAVDAYRRPVGLLHVQRRREQCALGAGGGDLVLLHRGHHRLRPEQAQACHLRRGAGHAQAQGAGRYRCGAGQPALRAAARLRIGGQIGPAALAVLRLQSRRAVRAGPFHHQPGSVQRARQGDVQCVRGVVHPREGDRRAALPQRGSLLRGERGNAGAGGAVERLELENRHAPVGGAVGAGQAQVTRLARGEEQALDAAERVGHGVGGLPLPAVQRGLQRVALGVGHIPGDPRAGDRGRRAQVHLEPVARAEGAAGNRLRVAIDEVADGHGRHLLRGAAGLPLAARRQCLGRCCQAQHQHRDEEGGAHAPVSHAWQGPAIGGQPHQALLGIPSI
ncbi:hypothetical protein D3C71_1075890 [compost metagenome]